jgi:hypothetical protein
MNKAIWIAVAAVSVLIVIVLVMPIYQIINGYLEGRM